MRRQLCNVVPMRRAVAGTAVGLVGGNYLLIDWTMELHILSKLPKNVITWTIP